MARPEKPITTTGPVADLARALRTLRRAGGSPTYRQMAEKAHFAASVLSQAANGHHVPSWDVTVAYVKYFGAHPAQYRALWEAAAEHTPRRATVTTIDGDPAIVFRKDLGAPVNPADHQRRGAGGRRRRAGGQNRWIGGGFVLVIIICLLAYAVHIDASPSTPKPSQSGLSGAASFPSRQAPTTPAELPPGARPAIPGPPHVPLGRDITPDYTVTPLEHLADFAATGPQTSNWDHHTGGDLIASVAHFDCTSQQTFTLPRGSERLITVVTAYTNGTDLTVTAIQDNIPTLSTTLINNQMTRIELATNHTRHLTLAVTAPTTEDGWCPTSAIKWHAPVIVKRSP